MTYRRYYIRAGAKSAAGGIVRVSSDFYLIEGTAVAREGDPVDCPACGTQGVIKCVMPRLPEDFEGKEYALSDDLCICKCSPPPKLMADQDTDFQMLDATPDESAVETAVHWAEGPSARAAGANTTSAPAASTKRTGMRPVRFIDQKTGTPYSNRPYRLVLVGGKVIQGTTASKGDTDLLSQEERGSLSAARAGPQ